MYCIKSLLALERLYKSLLLTQWLSFISFANTALFTIACLQSSHAVPDQKLDQSASCCGPLETFYILFLSKIRLLIFSLCHSLISRLNRNLESTRNSGSVTTAAVLTTILYCFQYPRSNQSQIQRFTPGKRILNHTSQEWFSALQTWLLWELCIQLSLKNHSEAVNAM